ncbi:MAG TPA: YncE family protein, partial [Thermoanaerobaculia bacterium]|nr:YncE family protein [Thermoanaerobaculia bacterium]
MKIAAAALSVLLASADLRAADPAPGPSYRVTGSYAVGGEGGWDYVTADAAARRLYVSRGTHVMVVDMDSGKVVGDVPGTDGVHGIALAPELRRGFTSNGRAGTVTVFELPSLAVAATWKTTGENPDAILYEPVSKRLLTFNGRGRNVTAFDAASGDVVGTLAVGGKPEFAVSDAAGIVYVNVEDTAEVLAFDARTLTVKGRWKLSSCEEPTGLALDAKSGRLFAGCSGNKTLSILSAVGGRPAGTVPIGAFCDAAAFDPATGLVFASAGDGTLTVVRETAPGVYAAVETVATKKGARTMALDLSTHRLFLPAAQFGPPPSPTAEAPRP